MRSKTIILIAVALITTLALISSAYSGKIMSKEEAIKALFKDIQVKEEKKPISDDLKKKLEKDLGYQLNKELDKEKTFFIATKDGKLVNYGCLDTIKDKYGYITYLVKLDLKGAVEQVLVLFHSDEKAMKVSYPEFLKQFTAKSAKDPIALGKDINAATGATISSQAISEGIRKVVLLTQELYLKPAQATPESKPKK
jgi:Na+-translocating ferredoxin:NAD+ oxidoreductase RnfG subunit